MVLPRAPSFAALMPPLPPPCQSLGEVEIGDEYYSRWGVGDEVRDEVSEDESSKTRKVQVKTETNNVLHFAEENVAAMRQRAQSETYFLAPTKYDPITPDEKLVEVNELLPALEKEDAVKINEFDRFVGHEDFGRLLTVAAKVKALRSAIKETEAALDMAIMSLPFDGNGGEIEATANVIRKHAREDQTPDNVPRGLFPITDSLLDEAIDSLTKEFSRCLVIHSAVEGSREEGNKSRSNKRKKKGGQAGEAIAVKYSKRQTDILTAWMIQHRVSYLTARYSPQYAFRHYFSLLHDSIHLL